MGLVTDVGGGALDFSRIVLESDNASLVYDQSLVDISIATDISAFTQAETTTRFNALSSYPGLVVNSESAGELTAVSYVNNQSAGTVGTAIDTRFVITNEQTGEGVTANRGVSVGAVWEDGELSFRLGVPNARAASPIERLRVVEDKMGLGLTQPSAILNIKPGTATANTAPLKLTAGVNLTTPEAGAIEFDGTDLFITQTTGPTRKTIAFQGDVATDIATSLSIANTYTDATRLVASAVLDFGSTAAQTSTDLTITVTGATIGEPVSVGATIFPANGDFSAQVTSADTVTVRFNNYSSGAIDPASGTFKVTIHR